MEIEDILRKEIAKVLNVPEQDIQDSENLLMLGLHSLAIMQLADSFSVQFNKKLSYASLAQTPTLLAWTDIIKNH